MTDEVKFDSAACEARMLSGRTFTYKQMRGEFTCDDDHHRDVDKAIQRLRRAGKIAFVREGLTCIWTAVTAVDGAEK